MCNVQKRHSPDILNDYEVQILSISSFPPEHYWWYSFYAENVPRCSEGGTASTGGIGIADIGSDGCQMCVLLFIILVYYNKYLHSGGTGAVLGVLLIL